MHYLLLLHQTNLIKIPLYSQQLIAKVKLMKKTSLPENAYRELKEGEEYQPIMSADTVPAEATPYSVTMGIIMAIIFSAAAAFLGLKVGQVF